MTKPTLLPEPTDERAGRRRTFTAESKASVLAECDAALANDGRIREVLRREVLCSSHLHDWRRARHGGGEATLARERGRPLLDPGFKAQRKEIGCLSARERRAEGASAPSGHQLDAPHKLAELLAPLAGPTSGSAG